MVGGMSSCGNADSVASGAEAEVEVGSGAEVFWLGAVLGVLVSDVPEHEAINTDAATSTVGCNQRPAVR